MTRQREASDVRRRQLVAATIRSIGRRGLDGCSINAITRSAGVSRGLVHHYFRNKDELLCAAYRSLGDDMMEELRKIASEDRAPVDRLEAVVRGAFVPPVSSPTKMSAWLGFWHASRANPRLLAINRDIYAEWRAFLTQLVDDAARNPDCGADTSAVVPTLISLMDGAWVELAIDSDLDAPEARALGYIRLAMGGAGTRAS